jgi:hypothetical protein
MVNRVVEITSKKWMLKRFQIFKIFFSFFDMAELFVYVVTAVVDEKKPQKNLHKNLPTLQKPIDPKSKPMDRGFSPTSSCAQLT